MSESERQPPSGGALNDREPPPEGEDELVDPGLAALEDRPEELAGGVVIASEEEPAGPASESPGPEPGGPPAARPNAAAWRVGVRLADGQVVDFDPRELDLRRGDMVVVDNDKDLNLGRVVYRAPNASGRWLRRVVRVVGPRDLLYLRNLKREEEAYTLGAQRISERDLPMKLVRVVYLHGGNKAVFYFTSDGRVDFRNLVRDLAQQLHVRIEMRQIGVRDEARLLTGYGICGQPLCCSRYLKRFVPVSIKMAKNQGLALNPQKVSGVCGRLMCCLVYEDAVYKELRQGFPKVGKTIETPRGPGKVLEADALGGRVRVLLEEGIESFTIEEIRTGQLQPRSEDPIGRIPGQSVVSRVRERLLEQRKSEAEPGAGPAEPEDEGAAQPAPAEVPVRTETRVADPAAGSPVERAGDGERRGRRRRRRRPGGQPPAPGSSQAGPSPQARPPAPAASQTRPAPPARERAEAGASSPSQPQASAEERRRPRRRRRRRPGGGSPGPGGAGPAP